MDARQSLHTANIFGAQTSISYVSTRLQLQYTPFKHWSQELLAYECAIIHRLNKMMKNVDKVSQYIDLLVHKYLVVVFNMRTDIIHLYSFTYNLDVSLKQNNPRNIYDTDLLSNHITMSTGPTLLVLYHISFRFSLSILSNYHASVPSSLLSIVVPPEDIVWLLFDSVTHYFGSQLESYSGGIFTQYILGISMIYYRVASYLPSRSTV